MIGGPELALAFRRLKIPPLRPVVAHAQTVVEALLEVFPVLIMPGFTYKTMVVPEVGPPDNALVYGAYTDANLRAEFYQPNMPVDRLIGAIPEALRRQGSAKRSMHPILSFTGVKAERFLDSQTLAEPLGPFHLLVEAKAWVLLVGVDHTANTAIHFAERLAGRKQFVRWALMPRGVVECPGFPGCSDGFNAIASRLAYAVREEQAGQARLQAVPILDLVQVTLDWLEGNPLALLCNHSYCERCRAIRTEFARFAQKH
jgi:aminoglycoside 3-N-acetyltransferase